jgi:prepilin-type N-terminal cleavage/methylation domain-containing protein
MDRMSQVPANLNSDSSPLSPSGFTLMELLVVIAVVAMLAGLSLPALARVKQRAANVHCLNNLRQLGLALRFYAEEGDGRLPSVGDEDPVGPLGPQLRQTVDAGAAELFKCRADLHGRFERTGSSYDWNRSFNGRLLHGAKAASRASPRTSDALLFDHEPWHGHRNGVFVDGRTERLWD